MSIFPFLNLFSLFDSLLWIADLGRIEIPCISRTVVYISLELNQTPESSRRIEQSKLRNSINEFIYVSTTSYQH